jgi:hypothetical protein
MSPPYRFGAIAKLESGRQSNAYILDGAHGYYCPEKLEKPRKADIANLHLSEIDFLGHLAELARLLRDVRTQSIRRR